MTAKYKKTRIDYNSIFSDLWQHLHLLIATALMLAGLTLIASLLFLPRQYASQAMLIINSGDRGWNYITSDQLKASSSLVNLYSIVLDNDSIRKQVDSNFDHLGVREKKITQFKVSSVDNTPVMQITIISPDADFAWAYCSEIVSIAPGVIQKAMGGTVKVISPPSRDATPVSPHIWKNTLLAACIGLLLSITISILTTLLHTTIRKEEDLLPLGLPLLGIIPGCTQEEL